MTGSLSNAQARRVALAAQGFTRARPAKPTARHLRSVMSRLGITQIDSVNVFARAHCMPAFSRLGVYRHDDLERLFFSPQSPYVEYWAHEATMIPVEDWALWQFRMDDMRAKYGGGWFEEHRETVDWVRAELSARGPLRPADIEHDSRAAKKGPWWDWDAVKRSLEYLFLFGEVAIAGRRGFERHYGLAEHVIPAEHRARTVSRDEAIRELVRRATIAYGVATAADVADYYRIRNRAAVTAALDEFVDAGELERVSVDGWTAGGRPTVAYLRADTVIPRRVSTTALLSPFDPLVWFRDRNERLFDFHYRIEIYTPAAKRRFGYYSLPVLVDDRIVGRVDLKADRERSTLLVQSAWWEDGVSSVAGMRSDVAERVAAELRLAADWQRLEDVSVSGWGDAVDDIAAAMRNARRHEHAGGRSGR